LAVRRVGAAAIVAAGLLAVGCASGTTDPPTDVTDRGATLRAHGSAGGKPTTYWFEYGPTTSYGSSTPRRDAGSGTAEQAVSERITGLNPDTTYNYRACASNADGSGCGSNVSFRTGSLGLLPGFQETIAINGLVSPTAVRFAPDGRVFVAEQNGIVKVFDSLSDNTATIVADLRTKVHNYWDRGLLGFALHPEFPAEPYLYVLYTFDALIGGTPPRWGVAGQISDACPTPPGPTTDGCVVSGRLSRLQLTGSTVGPEQVLIEDWCQQFPSHSVGDIDFGADGALYATGGDGASFDYGDFGQSGNPRNPCGDPPTGVGGNQTPPTAEGGALRSQDVRSPSDPTGLSGTIIRVDPVTGEALPSNPLAGRTDPNARRIIAQGLRNPFRMTMRPGTSEPWVGDVGWGSWEEINRSPTPPGGLENFGWPCYEGSGRQGGYDSLNVNLCESLYATGPVRAPFYSYNHGAKVYSEETCPIGSSSISGLAFNPPGSQLPAEFDGALFFADYSRSCIWAMERDGAALPQTSRIRTFRAGAAGVVNLEFGPGGDLFYPDLNHGEIKRIHYAPGNQAPRAIVSATPSNGPTPLNVSFSATGSSDPEGAPLSYAWDLDSDGAYDDATGATASFTYTSAGSYLAGLRVTDDKGASASDAVAIRAGNTPPTATITAPSPGFTWKVGDPITFSGSATDAQETLDASDLSWTLKLQHCPSNCHEHVVQSWSGASGATVAAPDHEYPSYLELTLRATDSGGLSDSRTIRLDPKTVALSFATSPTGLSLSVNGVTSTAPFTRAVIQGSVNGLAGPTPQTLASGTYDFSSWSDGGARVHNITAPTNRSFTATYRKRP
jgi:glucose/arabinose dehydrogenase